MRSPRPAPPRPGGCGREAEDVEVRARGRDLTCGLVGDLLGTRSVVGQGLRGE